MRYRSQLQVYFLAIAVPLVGTLGNCLAGERCYLLMFATQRFPNCPKYSHTFATFVKITDGENEPLRVETRTISWLPESMKLHVWRFFPDCGCNFDLHETIDWALANGATVSLWGPYEIQPELYCRAVDRAAFLESGEIKWKALDIGYRPARAVDCIHAVSGVDLDSGFMHVGTAHGDRASYLTLLHFERWLICPQVAHPELLGILHLATCPLVMREFDELPRAPTILRRPFYTR